MKKSKVLLLALILSCVHTVGAETLRFDFSGFTFLQANSSDERIFTGTYDGFFLIDTTVSDTGPFPSVSFFENSLIDGLVTINDVSYTLQEGGLNRSGVTNNAGAAYDSFYVTADVVNENGQVGQFALQLVDLSNLYFDSTTMPTNLTLDGFDPLDQFFMGSLAFLILPPTNETMTVEFANLRPVPLPGAFLLLGSAVLGAAGLRKL